MNEFDFETRMRTIAQRMKYPPTPDIAGRVMTRLNPMPQPRFMTRKLAWSLTLIVIFLLSISFIPPVRAAILEFIQIGIVRIFPRPTESPTEIFPTSTPDVFTSPLESSKLLIDLNRLAGETTLANAQTIVSYPILLPTYPADLGEPSHVFVQDVGDAMTILVWLDPNDSKKVLMSLHFIPNESWAVKKFAPTVIEETEVNGQSAIWAVGPYPLILSNHEVEFTRLINGHVLIWTDGAITYRLETGLELEEAVKIAESLQPLP